MIQTLELILCVFAILLVGALGSINYYFLPAIFGFDKDLKLPIEKVMAFIILLCFDFIGVGMLILTYLQITLVSSVWHIQLP